VGKFASPAAAELAHPQGQAVQRRTMLHHCYPAGIANQPVDWSRCLRPCDGRLCTGQVEDMNALGTFLVASLDADRNSDLRLTLRMSLSVLRWGK